MKVRLDIVLDLDSGDYDVKFHNLSAPGQAMDYLRIRRALRNVIADVDEQQGRAAPEAQPKPGQHRRPELPRS